MTRGVILAGVHDWGGTGLSAASPRPLLPLANRPLITYSLDWLGSSGVREACICANSDTTFLRSCVNATPSGIERLEFYEDVMPRGPAGCARDAWCGSDRDTMVVTDGTIVPRVDLSALLDAHQRSGALMTVVVTRADGSAIGAGLLSPLGVYVMSKRVLEFIPKAGHFDIKEALIPLLHEREQKVVTFMSDVPSPRVTGTSSYMAVNEWMVQQVCWEDSQRRDYRRVDGSLVHLSATVAPTAKLIGPVLVGSGSRIGRGVTIVGPVSIGRDCTIDEGAVISRSSIWDRCRVGADTTMDRCVVTHDARLRESRSVRQQVLSEKSRRHNGATNGERKQRP